MIDRLIPQLQQTLRIRRIVNQHNPFLRDARGAIKVALYSTRNGYHPICKGIPEFHIKSLDGAIFTIKERPTRPHRRRISFTHHDIGFCMYPARRHYSQHIGVG
ncbi:hypothetical protein HRbin15_02633 [bacterium HR15]|nr:hypothetical protein HRbin15_02633 [bacterium HR15]